MQITAPYNFQKNLKTDRVFPIHATDLFGGRRRVIDLFRVQLVPTECLQGYEGKIKCNQWTSSAKSTDHMKQELVSVSRGNRDIFPSSGSVTFHLQRWHSGRLLRPFHSAFKVRYLVRYGNLTTHCHAL